MIHFSLATGVQHPVVFPGRKAIAPSTRPASTMPGASIEKEYDDEF